MTPPFLDSQFVWIEGSDTAANQFVSFEKEVLKQSEEPCRLHLFADSRFRLWVNDVFVAYGPGRFVTSHPEYDTYDLGPWLAQGANRVRVEVNYYGSSSYQSMPDGKPGFIADGGTDDGAVDFSTPGDWQARVHTAWRADAPHFSFAQNAIEWCDTRVLESENSQRSGRRNPRVLRGGDCPWGPLRARSVRYPDYAVQRPFKTTLAAPHLKSPMWYGFQSVCDNVSIRYIPGKRYRRLFATWIHSEVEQTIPMECFWSRLHLNGKALEVECETPFGNNGTVPLDLNKGWNLLLGQVDLLSDYWTYQIRFPDDAQITIHAIPKLSCDAVFSLAPAKQGAELTEEMLGALADTHSVFDGWKWSSGCTSELTPARQVAWDRIDFQKGREPSRFTGEVSRLLAREATWCFEFEREFYGHPALEVSAPAGTILDVSYGDWCWEDGRVDLYGSNPLVDATDRFVLKGGVQRIQVLNPRGGIYLQATLRTPAGCGEAELSVHDIAIKDRTLFKEVAGTFVSGERAFDFAWEASVATFRSSTDEAYSDCPWRERGTYIGDALVTQQLNARLSTDMSVALRTFQNFGYVVLPDGQLPCCAPSWLRLPHEDFTYLWVLSIRDHWALTGNEQALRDSWQVVERIWDYNWDLHASGLWNANGHRLFVDWGCLRSEREGEANAVINILRIAALEATSEIAKVIGLRDLASRFKVEAQKVRSTVENVLWDGEQNRFRASLSGPKTAALHANILALRYGVGDAASIVDYLEPYLRDNLSRGLEMDKFSGYVELYYLYYLLPALAELGRLELAEELIEQHYGYLEERGCATLSECFGVIRESGSLCHVWSSAGALYMHQNVLGLRQAVPGDPDKWILSPRATKRFNKVFGTMPHRLGSIRVFWSRNQDGHIDLEYEAPEGVEIVPVGALQVG